MAKEISRRRALGVAGASAAGVAGIAAVATAEIVHPSRQRAGTAARTARTARFVSRPDLDPPPITVHQYGHVPPDRYIFLNTPASGPGTGGAEIIDHKGELIWFGPNTPGRHKQDFNVQMYDGEPVLTWWEGRIVFGHGEGRAVIADANYQVKHIIALKSPDVADLHEFVVTPQGTAIIDAFRLHSGVDLTALGGPASGYIFSGVFQEIDIATGKLLFEWDSYNPASPPVPVSETYITLGQQGVKAEPFDYFHINSIYPDTDGNYLVSSRHAWTVYKVSKADGSIMWRMNGKHSDFAMGPGTSFMWQHHVRPHGNGEMTIFDNGFCRKGRPAEKQSRALLLNVDQAAKTVTLQRAVTHPKVPMLASGLGDVQMLPGGEMFVGWGDARRFSQFGAQGRILLDGIVERTASSYRVFSQPWAGRPADPPDVAARHRTGGGATVYASWNGATELASWTVYAGRSGHLRKVATAARTGFETAINVSSTGPYFAVEAHDSSGKALARSKPVTIA